MSLNSPKSIADIDFANLTKRKYTPSPDFWSDQVLYFLMLDRFSDGNEKGGYRDALGQPITRGATPLATSDDIGSVPYWQWLGEAAGWQGGTLKGLRSKLGYLRRQGVTALWISPDYKQAAYEPTYHGYGIQNYLDSLTRLKDFAPAMVDPSFPLIHQIGRLSTRPGQTERSGPESYRRPAVSRAREG